MDYRVLGPLEVESDDGPITLGGPKPRSLVAILLAARGALVSAAALAEDLWGGDPPASAAATLQAYVSRLRAVLPEGVLRSESGGYRLVPDLGEFDADRFEAAVAAGRAAKAVGDIPSALLHFNAAEAEWRGAALPELADAPAFRPESSRLDELRLTALEERLGLELEAGRHSRAVPELEAATRQHPLREDLHALLMLALYRSGRQTDALRAFQTARAHLAEDVGLDPGPRLARLEQAILAQDSSLDFEGRSSLSTGPNPRPLPSSVSSFLGRDAELADLAPFLDANRLVTLVGAGGAGKSRLALEVASERQADGDKWVALVELVNISKPDDVAGAFRQALGVPAPTEPAQTDDVAAAIGSTRGLIVVDNAEHLVGATGSFVEALLVACPELRVLVTSRTVLDVAGEAVWRVGGLGVDDAIALFRARAGQAQSADDESVAAMCSRVDGLPLPIELAAARLRHMSFGALRVGLDDRLSLLDDSGTRDRIAHHRTVTALVEWSLDLLHDSDRELMAVLSVFEGGFELDAAARTAALFKVLDLDVKRALDRLVDNSLVEISPSGRYRVLETVRSVSSRPLDTDGRAALLSHAHLGWTSEFAALILDLSTDQATWVDRMRLEMPNVRTALAWALGAGEEPDVALRLATRAAGVWYLDGPMSEGRRWLEACLDRATTGTFDYGRALNYLAVLAWSQGDVPIAEPAARQSLEIFREVGEAKWIAIGLNLLGDIARGTGKVDEALRLNTEALDLARPLDPDTIGTALINLACIHLDVSNFDAALPLVEEAAGLLEHVDSAPKLGAALYNLATIRKAKGDLDAAEECLKRADEIYRRTGDDHGVAFVLHGRAMSALAQSRLDLAAEFVNEGLVIARKRGDELFVVELLITQARVEIEWGLHQKAESSLREVLAIERSCGSQMRTSEALRLLATLAADAGNLFDARAFAEQALTVAHQTGNNTEITEASDFVARICEPASAPG